MDEIFSNESRWGLQDQEYEKCHKVAADAYEKLKDPLSGAVKKITDSIYESFHEYIMNWMESDMDSNFGSLVRERSERIIDGLFNGKYNQGLAEQWLGSYDFEKYREGVAKNYPHIIKEKLIDDLMEENKRLKEQLEWTRRN